MSFLSKILFCSVFTTLILFSSCDSQKFATHTNNIENALVAKNEIGDIDFEEMRRLNVNIELQEITILKSFDTILNLYQKLEDPVYPRSYPIPTLKESESLIVIKPPLKKIKYGDLEIITLQKKEETLFIHYKEIHNNEYDRNQDSNPIVIIKISEEFKNVQLSLRS